MASNETVAEIVKEMRERAKDKWTDTGAWLSSKHVGLMLEEYANAVNSANKREVAAKDGKRKGLLKANASLAADNDRLRREIAELCVCLKEAASFRCGECWFTVHEGICPHSLDKDCIVFRWRKALEGAGND